MFTTIADYQILRVLGEGGMGKVYLARHLEKGKQAAIKSLHPETAQTDQYKHRFQREGEVLARLNHPGIVRFYDFKFIDGVFYLIMEYAPGNSLTNHILNNTGPLPTEKSVRLMCNILDIFQYAHSQGVIHRDVKPDNFIINGDQIKILDFGIAKIKNAKSITTLGTVMGTPAYMSPEQVKGLEVDHRSDIYSLGIMLFFMVTGQAPYNERELSEFDINQKTLREPLPRANQFYPHVPAFIQDVIDRATQKNADQRFQSCKEFKNTLLSLLQTSGISNTASLRQESNNQNDDVSMMTIIVGRDPSCQIIISDSTGSVSRRHAEISLSSGQYVFRDFSTNGTTVNGQLIRNNSTLVQPGVPVLLAGKIPLPWDKVIALLPLAGAVDSHSPTQVQQSPPNVPSPGPQHFSPQPVPAQSADYVYSSQKPDKLEIGWGILAFLFPLAGWIMYFAWKSKTPNRANNAGALGVAGFIVNLVLIFGS